MILLDTHALVWLDEGSLKLGKKSLAYIDEALKNSELFVSTISFWEIAMLINKGRLELQIEAVLWRQNLMHNGLQEIVISGDIAIAAAHLKDFHGDPADRIIVATAINTTATLCTADKKILSWESDLIRLNARK